MSASEWMARGCLAALAAGFAATLRIGTPTSWAEPPGVGASAPVEPIAAALENAQQAYSRGEFESARTWSELACKLLDDATHRQQPRTAWRTGNARQLLETLQLYAFFARGLHADLDAEHESLVAALQQVHFLNHCADFPSRLAGERVEYDLMTRLVRRIGERRIDYDLITRQIDRVGEARIRYHLMTRMPEKIGAIEVEYDLIDRRMTSIGGVEVR